MKDKRVNQLCSMLAALMLISVSTNSGAVVATPPKGIDSTKIQSPEELKDKDNIKYIETKSDLLPTSDEEFNRLPPCPKPAPTNCPDLNGGGTIARGGASDSALTCPNLCVVKRVDVYPKEVTGLDLEDKSVKVYDTSGYSEQAFCPPTYSSVGVYDMQDDQSYYSPGPTVTNIKSMDSINKLQAAGYTCSGNGTQQSTPRPRGGQSWDANNYCPGNFLKLNDDSINTFKNAQQAARDKIDADYEAAKAAAIAANQPIPTKPDYPAAGDIGLTFGNPQYMIDPVNFGTPDVVQLTDYEMVYSSCKGSCAPCGGWEVDLHFQAYFQVVMCAAPPGWYPTNSKSPHGTVCARVRSEWKSLQNDPAP